MRMRFVTQHAIVPIALALGLSLGCGSGGIAGCGGMEALPNQPAPWGFPMDQAIEGGIQARITKPGFDKVSSLIPSLAGSALPTQSSPMCLPQDTQNVSLSIVSGDFNYCNMTCTGSTSGCPIWLSLRPDLAPPGGIGVSVPDNSTAANVNIDIAFDAHVRVPLRARACEDLIGHVCTGWFDICSTGNPLRLDTNGTHIRAQIPLGIDPPTGKLTIALGNINIDALNLQAGGCGVAGDVLNFVLGIVNAFASSAIGNLVVNLIKPQLESLIQGFLPNPPGLVGRMDLASTLADYNPPKEAGLEMLMVAGGYVSGKAGGLNLGVITGINSDRDLSSRVGTAGTPDPINSEPSLCVPVRPVYDLGGPPWNLPLQPLRLDHMLMPAGDFSGAPDPTDAMGNTQDLAIGVSRTFLDLAGFHLYNSGTLCLSISGGVLSALNAGTLQVLVPSLSNILENKKAPVAIVLRPQQPLMFTLGTGTPDDATLQIHATDLRLDFYTFIEERYVRLFTLALDANLGLNLAITMDDQGNPAIAPMITGLDKSSIQMRVSNTDLLQEDPAKLVKLLSNIIDVAAGQLGGAIKPIALPSLMGFSLDDLTIQRVQTPEDDFLGIFGSLKQDPEGMMARVSPDVVQVRRLPNRIGATAAIVDVSVPPPDVIRATLLADKPAAGDLPSVTLSLGGTANDLEWSYRIDGGFWHPWSTDARPTISDASFLLQGHHAIEVRARVHNDWTTESTPQHLDVIIDSAPPDLKLVPEDGRVEFKASDNVSDDDTLRYSWQTPDGWTEPSTIQSFLTLNDAWAATAQGTRPLLVAAYDEQGNRTVAHLDLGSLNQFHGRTTTPTSGSGCSCTVGGSDANAGGPLALLVLVSFVGLFFRRSFRRA